MIFSLTAAGVLVSCATTEKQSQQQLINKVVFESKASLLNWHDVTHKSYFGLKGPVKKLVIKPVVLVGGSLQTVSDEWELQFNIDGRLTSKTKLNDKSEFKTSYAYSEQGELKHVTSYEKNKLWRSSVFSYDNGQLVKIQFTDKKTNDHQLAKITKQDILNGWFEIQKPITSPGLPVYSQFSKDNGLVWSNKGDINNGLGELFYLRTVDGVTSSSVENKRTAKMQGVGGYRYLYGNDGLLMVVESYNAHANRLFHKTSYKYNELGLLVSEDRKVVDKSPFNEAIDENVIYDYLEIDERGNWTKRKLNYKSRYQSQQFSETRVVSYF